MGEVCIAQPVTIGINTRIILPVISTKPRTADYVGACYLCYVEEIMRSSKRIVMSIYGIIEIIIV